MCSKDHASVMQASLLPSALVQPTVPSSLPFTYRQISQRSPPLSSYSSKHSELAPTGTASGSIVEATTDPVDLATDSPAIEATSLGDAAAPILATAAGDEDAAVGSETVTPVEAVTVTTAPTDAVVAATAAPTDAVADNVTTAPVDAATSAPVDAATAAPVTSGEPLFLSLLSRIVRACTRKKSHETRATLLLS